MQRDQGKTEPGTVALGNVWRGSSIRRLAACTLNTARFGVSCTGACVVQPASFCGTSNDGNWRRGIDRTYSR
uniref:Uncharacterized protein n=1 Tax=Romanomermis culicivorax TaxID=13658 RepID=A0A915L4F4_ROMCU